jgi:cyclohexanecarboxyl-CoA dehydrogenase
VDFNFSKEEELWQWAVKDFTDRELAPREFKAFDAAFRDTIIKMGELGFLGVNLPERYGGDPANSVMFGMLLEEVARDNAAVAYYILTTQEVCTALEAFAADDMKEQWLPGLIRGESIPCIAATEQASGCDFDAMATGAEIYNGLYRISGRKAPVSFGLAADIALTFAQTESAGPTAFLVPLDLAGIDKSTEPFMGLSLASPAALQFNGVPIPIRCRIGDEGAGRHIAVVTGPLSSLHQIATGLISLGMAQTALKLAARYAKEDMTLIEAGKWLCYRALSLKDSGKPHVKEAAMCGWWCPKISHQAIQNSLLIHGHSGYSDDHPFEQMLRDVVGFEIISGTESILKTIIGNQVLGPTGVPDCLIELSSSY